MLANFDDDSVLPIGVALFDTDAYVFGENRRVDKVQPVLRLPGQNSDQDRGVDELVFLHVVADRLTLDIHALGPLQELACQLSEFLGEVYPRRVGLGRGGNQDRSVHYTRNRVRVRFPGKRQELLGYLDRHSLLRLRRTGACRVKVREKFTSERECRCRQLAAWKQCLSGVDRVHTYCTYRRATGVLNFLRL